MSPRDRLVAACDAGDHQAVHREGFGAVWEALSTWWAPRQTCPLSELVPYMKALGDYDPADVLQAIEACSGEWRPVPGQIKGYLNAKRGESAKVDVGRGRDRAGTAEALQAVAAAVAAGERECSCGVRRPTWKIDHAHVLRCVGCGGLEVGQVYAAEDGGLLEVAAS